jgi:hypothetical protein
MVVCSRRRGNNGGIRALVFFLRGCLVDVVMVELWCGCLVGMWRRRRRRLWALGGRRQAAAVVLV